MDDEITEISAVASRYLQMIAENKNYEAANVYRPDSPVYNQFMMNINDDKQHGNIFHSPLDSTDILIGGSNDFFETEDAQMSFLSRSENATSMLFADPASLENTFEAALQDSNNNMSSSFFCPPSKRFCYSNKQNSFFCPSVVERSSVMTKDTFFRHGVTNCTEDLFNDRYLKDDSMNFVTSFSNVSKPVPKLQIQVSAASFSQSSINDDSRDVNLCASTSQGPNPFLAESCFDNFSKVSDFSFMKDKENQSTKKSSNKVNTFYQTPYIVDTEKIEEYYKNHKFDKFDPSKDNVDDIMEPSLDYIAYRLQCLKPLTVGSEEENLECEPDGFNCKSINGTFEEIEGSFDIGKFVCSTPEEKEIDETNIGTNPLDIGFINQMTDLNSNPQDDDYGEKTRSDLLISDRTIDNVWSKLTHVSCSVPQSDEPQFDLTTIFDFNYRDDVTNAEDNRDKYVEGDTARYELLLSILKDQDNPFEKTTAYMHETIKLVQNRKAAIMGQIEMILQALVSSLVKQETMILKLHRIKDWKDCKFASNMLSQNETAIKIKSLSFTNKNTERTFTIVVHLLGEIYKLLSQNMTCTKRELYYRDVELMKSQNSVNKAIDEICALLNVQCWELGVLSTSKGLIAGDLKITTEDDEVIDYSTTNSVPQKPSGIKSMESCAEYVLVVEKDTVFTRLIEDGIMDKIGTKIILITAKGYPDVNTRLLLKKIETDLDIPIYIIVDADPYGIDIMCTYKFGSLQMVQFSEQLAITKMEWIGIYPSDIEKLDVTRTQLTDADSKKVDELMKRPYVNKQLMNELMCFKEHGLKAEIESIYHFSIDYLIHDYIPQKISMIMSPMLEIIEGNKNFNEKIF